MAHQTAVGNRIVPKLSYAEYIILLTILKQSMSGITIFETLLQETNDQLVLSPGTLYNALQRLRGEGLIDILDGPKDEASKEQGPKLYRANSCGYEAIMQMRTWMERELAVIDTHIDPKQPPTSPQMPELHPGSIWSFRSRTRNRQPEQITL
ncbi:MAG: PadR family transcriptional regulator [Oscillochloris sp.]|nr:PadR family transcriptional regulator [Oscillochloris sp.]